MTTLHDLEEEISAKRKSVDSPSSPPSSLSPTSLQSLPSVSVNNRSQGREQLEQLIRISHDLSEITSSNPNSLVPESLSSASSFQSLASNLSCKSSSGICADFVPSSPDKTSGAFEHSYVNLDIPDVDELISACANIKLNESAHELLDISVNNLSQDQTFTSATNETIANETQIELRLEESIQTFETCPVLESNQVLKEASSLFSAFKTPVHSDQSSIIPYVSFESSVLQKYQNKSEKLDDIVFKSSLSSLQADKASSTPFTEVESAEDESKIPPRNETVIEVNNASEFLLKTTQDQKEEQDITEVNLCVDNAKKGQAFNSTNVLSLEPKLNESNESIAKTSENLNLSAFGLESNQKLNTTHKNELVKKREDIVHEPKIKSELIIQEGDNLNKIEIILQNSNILNAAQDLIEDENFLNKSEIIVEKDSLLNKTQKITEKLNTVNEIKFIVKDQYHLKNLEDIQNEIQNLNNVDALIKEDEEVSKYSNQVFTEKIHKLNLILKPGSLDIISKKEIEDKESEFIIQELSNPKISEISLNNEIKTSSKSEKLVGKKAVTSIPSETFHFAEPHKINRLNTEVVASTPLSTKNFMKEDKKESSNKKGALFINKLGFLDIDKEPEIIKNINIVIKKEAIEEDENIINFDETVAINKSLEKSFASELILKDNLSISNNLLQNINLHPLPLQESEYEAFKPQQQSTNLPFPEQCNFRVLQEAALSVAKDIDDSLEKIEESEHFVSATTELFGDPSALDFLNQVGSQTNRRGERYDSLYMKFDPLAQRQSMLPQKNVSTSPLFNEEEEKEVKVETTISNMGTPKKNPALAAIDRLLFYSPSTVPSTDTEVQETNQKKEVAEKQETHIVPIDEKIVKELELVRSTVLQLETELEKQKQDYKGLLDKQKESFEDKVNHMQTKCNQMQSQLTQEVKCKDQMTVVVEEYEKSISRLIAEREKDRTNFETEKTKIQEELQVANQHLSNTEAAFSDVHSKYERLKNVVSAYKSNETVLKESISENQETIKTLENRYEQLKSHAMAQLEKANLELNAIRKHNEAETVKLKALVRKAELKSKSLEETVEQKIKENKELTQIIDEMIARVD